MPEISRFFGMVVRMYFDDHPPPHFHSAYAGREAVIAISPLAVLRSDLSPRALALALEWAAMHAAELLENWERLRAGQPTERIAPLS